MKIAIQLAFPNFSESCCSTFNISIPSLPIEHHTEEEEERPPKRHRNSNNTCPSVPLCDSSHVTNGICHSLTPPTTWSFPTLPSVIVTISTTSVQLMLCVPRPQGFAELDADIPSQVTAYNLGLLFNIQPRLLLHHPSGHAVLPDAEGAFRLDPAAYHGTTLHLQGPAWPTLPPHHGQERQRLRQLLLKRLPQQARHAEQLLREWNWKVLRRRQAAALTSGPA
eukprot:EG_transcript_22931